MRILLISADVVGGLRKHVHYIARAGLHRGHEVHYAHGHAVDEVGRAELPQLAAEGCALLRLDIPKKPGPADAGNIVRLVRYCMAHGIDLVHGHGAKGGLYARAITALLRTPSIYTAHGGSVHARYGKLESFIYRCVEKSLKPFTTLFVFESAYTRDAFARVAGAVPEARQVLNSNGLDPAPYRSTRHWAHGLPGVVRLVCVGVLRDVKGQDILLRAARHLRERGFAFEIDFYGDGPDLAEYRRLAAEAGIADKVRFHGDVADIVPAFDAANLVVIPSRFESFGYVAVEAYAMRRPVVASRTGGLTENVTDGVTGRLFEPGNPAALAEAIVRAIEERDATDRMVEEGYRRMEQRYDVRRSLDNLFAIYEQCVGGRGGGAELSARRP